MEVGLGLAAVPKNINECLEKTIPPMKITHYRAPPNSASRDYYEDLNYEDMYLEIPLLCEVFQKYLIRSL